jgi:hypothetical protein
MRRIGITAVLWLVFVPSMLARGEAKVRSTQDQIKTLEQRWANAAVRADVSEVSTYEADDGCLRTQTVMSSAKRKIWRLCVLVMRR